MAYTIEEEQEINEIKNWWNENYKTIIVAVILSVGGSFGWRYWQEHQANKAQQLSAQYEQIIYASQDLTAKNERLDAFVKANNKTAYATLALLDKAKNAVNAQDYAQAEDALKQAIEQSPDDIFSSISALRLAGVQFQQQQFDAALSSLNLVKDPTWNSRKELLTGDILLAKGDKEGAKARYQAAQKDASMLEQQWLQVRLNNL